MKALATAIAGLCGLCFNLQAAAADLMETARTSGGMKLFMAAAETAGMAEKLKHSGPYTIFAPNDAAFRQLPAETRDALLRDKEKAAELVAYHVIPGAVTVADVKPGKVQTVQGSQVKLTSDNGSVTMENAKVVQSDLKADNGVIHEIDQVVLPPK